MTSETDGTKIEMTRDELRELIGEAVDETLVKLGIEAEDHKEMQADMLFLRKLRKTHETVQGRALITLVGTLVTGTIGLVILGIVKWIQGLGGGGTP